MRTYDNQSDLKKNINNSYKKFITEFESIPENLKDLLVDGIDKTPSQMLSYQIGWLSLLLSWEREGAVVVTPIINYKWNDLGNLYQSFYNDFGNQSLKNQKRQLDELVSDICDWVSTLSDEEFTESNQRLWASNKAQWPLWKWIHINTVAPFTNFRPKIRKWKKSLGIS